MNTWRRTCAMRIALTVLLTAIISLSNVVFAYAESIISFEEKTPLEYTLEEYEMLTPQQQDDFFLWFDSIEAFEAWMAEAAPQMPWELANRNPAEYTWNEYNELTNAQQEAFIANFESVDAFESWLESVYSEEAVAMPWENADKTPAEYAWEEYEELTLAQQNAFVEWFDNASDFEAWMEAVEAAPADSASMPWMKGGKTPNAYTLAEFEALTVMQQDAFIEWFDSIDAFEAWMEAVNPTTNTELITPWANDKKQPDAYTPDEFKELSAYQQSRFFMWFETYEEFDSWLDAVAFEADEVQMPVNEENETEEAEESADMTDAEESKDADEIKIYTWLEFEQMTPEQRILLFREFGSVEGFKLWVETSKPDHVIDTLMPWDNFKRQPAEYTWEEYEAMPVELQDAFFRWFESTELFEEWMKTTAGLDVLTAYGIVDPNSDLSAEPLVDEQNGERTKDAYPCKGRTIKNRVNIRTEANIQSAVVGMVDEQGTEMIVVGIMLEGDTPWYLVNVGKTKGFIRGDLMEIVSVE